MILLLELRLYLNLFYLILLHDNVPQLRDYSGILTNNYEPRNSLDNVCNQQGQLLLDDCKSHSLLIANGRVGDDKSVGNYTYAVFSFRPCFLRATLSSVYYISSTGKS